MTWLVEDRLKPYASRRAEPYLTDAIKTQVAEKYFPRYPRKQAALLPLFHRLRQEYGYIPEQAIDETADFLGIARAEVQDAVSFYEEFRLTPSGEYVISVCRSISCELCGSRAVLERIRHVFGVDPGETTADHKITVLEVECLGACEQAPCALVNEDLHGHLEPDNFVRKLQALSAARDDQGRAAAPTGQTHI